MEKEKKNRGITMPMLSLVHDPLSINAKCDLIAGRAGVIAAILVFIGTYSYGISKFGFVLGIALGWLPCGLAAWLSAIAVASTSNYTLRYIVMTTQRFPLLARLMRAGAPRKD